MSKDYRYTTSCSHDSIGVYVTKGQNENDSIKKFKTHVKDEISTQLSQP